VFLKSQYILEGGNLLKETLPPPTDSPLLGITAGRLVSDLPLSTGMYAELTNYGK